MYWMPLFGMLEDRGFEVILKEDGTERVGRLLRVQHPSKSRIQAKLRLVTR